MNYKTSIILIGLILVSAAGCVNKPSTGVNESTPVKVTPNVSVEKTPTSSAAEAQETSALGTTHESIAGYNPIIDPQNFVKSIDNPYFPLKPGTTFTYEGKTEEGIERNEVSVTNQTKEILGVNTTVVHDKVWENGELIEETFDWYIQDKEGNVWYLGEDSKEFEDGKVVSTEGSWEAGVDEAKPGIIMKANPPVGDRYLQEYYKGHAEDMAEVVSLNESVSVAYGSYENCLKTKEWTPLEPGVEENKYYARGIGTVLEATAKGGSGRMELINVRTE